MNVTSAAPRLRASMPSAPVPANPSSTRALAMRGARMLNSVSRSLSDVGLSPSHVGAFRRRPFNDPAITRIIAARLKPSRYTSRSLPDPPDQPDPPDPPDQLDPSDPPDLPDLNELEALLPAGQQLVDAGGARRERLKPARRLALRRVQHVAVTHEIDHAECRDAGLPRPDEIARAPQPQIPLRD